MGQCRLKCLAIIPVAAVVFLAGGCLTSIDEACTESAQTHCANCYSCAADVDGLTGAELCDVPADEGTSKGACESALGALCERQARTLQDPFDDLDRCNEALNSETCNQLVEREALDQPSAPSECSMFL